MVTINLAPPNNKRPSPAAISDSREPSGTWIDPGKTRGLFQPIIDTSSGAIDGDASRLKFDPQRHLAYKAAGKSIMMEDIGYSEDEVLSPVAVTEPFRLFSPEAVQRIRDEVLRPEVLKDCQYQGVLGACYLRATASKQFPFVHDAWSAPETLAIISKLAGVELVPVMDYEIAHINVSVKSAQEADAELLAMENEQRQHRADEGIAGCPFEDDKPVVGWHRDSYPFVCVTMLSSCENMVGGETALRTKAGSILKVRGPQMGCAVVMQGRYITHQALRALGAQERITMVTSLRPRSAQLKDDSDLSTVRGISNISELHHGWADYRLKIMEERIHGQLQQLKDIYTAGGKTDTKQIKEFLADMEAFVKQTNDEMVPEAEIVEGQQPQLDIADAQPTAAGDQLVLGTAEVDVEAGPPSKKARR